MLAAALLCVQTVTFPPLLNRYVVSGAQNTAAKWEAACCQNRVMSHDFLELYSVCSVSMTLLDLLYCNCMHLTLCIHITEAAPCQLLSLHTEEGIRQNVCTRYPPCMTKPPRRYAECELLKERSMFLNTFSLNSVPRKSWKFN